MGCSIQCRTARGLRARPGAPGWTNAEDLPGALADEIVHFFTVYGDMQGKQLDLDGWGTHDEAMRLIEQGRERAGSGSE